jgi:fructose-bisphosphate aldolase class II
MFDGSNLPLKENLDIAVKLLERFQKSQLILEIETGVVGGEEDGVTGEMSEKLYTTPEDTLEVARRLNAVKGARYLLAATFGNAITASCKPGQVKLKPTGQSSWQAVVKARRARASTSSFTGSGSTLRKSTRRWTTESKDECRHRYAAAFTRAIAAHMFKNYDGEGQGTVSWQQEGVRPCSYLAQAEAAMAERVKQAVSDLEALGRPCMSVKTVDLETKSANADASIANSGAVRPETR